MSTPKEPDAHAVAVAEMRRGLNFLRLEVHESIVASLEGLFANVLRTAPVAAVGSAEAAPVPDGERRVEPAVVRFAEAVGVAFSPVVVTIHVPVKESGRWFIDLVLGEQRVGAEWRPGQGFRLSRGRTEAGYGDGPEEVFADVSAAVARAIVWLRASPEVRGVA